MGPPVKAPREQLARGNWKAGQSEERGGRRARGAVELGRGRS